MPGAMPRLQRKSPFLAGLLSLMPGIGQIYVGYYAIGFIHIAVFVTTIFLLVRMSVNPFSALTPALGVFLGFFVVYNIVDACRRAVLYNLALDGVQGIELPDMNASLPKLQLQGSVPGGAVLIALGVVLLSNTLLGFSLDWLASWWPLGLVALGAWLVAKAREERRAAGPPAGGRG
jgi:TM2 domain-containing membrane protein YozV